MSEISTRIWLDEKLWQAVRDRAIAEGITARELIPRLLNQALSEALTVASHPPTIEASAGPPIERLLTEAGPPVVTVADVYRCAACNAEVKAGGIGIHISKHIKERQAQQLERS